MTKKQKVASAWVVVIIAFIGGLALANIQNKTPPVMDIVMAAFNIGETDAGWLTSVFTIVGLITAIPTAAIMRKWGVKKTGVVALAFAAIGSAAGAFAPNFTILMITRVLEGVGVGLIAVVGPSVISMWFPPEKRALPMGVWGSWMMASQTLLFLIGGGLGAAFGWQGVWWFTFGFAVVALILYMWKVEEPPEGMPNYAEGEEEEGEFSFGEGFKSASTWILTIAATIFTFCCFGFATYISLYWAETFFNGDMIQSNTWVSIMYALEIPIAILLGWFLNHVRLSRRKYLAVVAFLIYAVILWMCFRLKDPGLLIPFIIAYPILEGALAIMHWTLGSLVAKKPEHIATSIGILNVGLNVGTLLGPPVTGFFIENYGWDVATIPLAVMAIVGAVFYGLVKVYDQKTGEVLK